MLDDLKFIHQKDAEDALGTAEKQWQQLQTDFEIPSINGDYKNVVFCGMGGSALAALISTSWPGWKVPFEICKTYEIPSYVNEHTILIASSYSGNTEETVEALKSALNKAGKIICITTGGEIKNIATENSLTTIILPEIGQPRYATLASLKAVVSVMDASGLSEVENSAQVLFNCSKTLNESIKNWLPTVPIKNNLAKSLSLELMGKSVVVYAGPKMFPAAYKWKISINENAKNIAWCNQLPEFNHNEFIGWSSHPINKPYVVIDIRSKFEHERVLKRFEITEKLLSGKRPAPHVVDVEGKTDIDQLLWAITLGDFVSLYLALLNGLNPTPVKLIEKLKNELAN